MSVTDWDARCRKMLNDGRHVCLFNAGHDGACHPHVNAPFPPVVDRGEAQVAADLSELEEMSVGGLRAAYIAHMRDEPDGAA